MKTIKKIRLSNFKKFNECEIDFNEKMNILIGDNEAGKSSVLLALDLVLSGSRGKVETMGMETLLNARGVERFLAGKKKFEDLPVMYAEVFLSEQNNPDLFGKCNSKDVNCDGLRLACEPIQEYGREILDVLAQEGDNFPYEYYSIKFSTFSDQAYSGYSRFVRHLVIDSSQINNEYATREYTKSIYSAHAGTAQKYKYQNEYRKHKGGFRDLVLNELNEKLEEYKFSVRNNSKSNLETDLVITEDGIPIDNKGKGKQCLIKTEFALRKNDGIDRIDALLLEEPENHLSHVNTKKLIRRIQDSKTKQIFVATHNNLICTRLDLRSTIMLNSSGASPLVLGALTEDTANFFMKAPDNNILEFILSKKVILVEGDAEFILIEALYRNVVPGVTAEADDVHVISVGGTSFKRYLELAKILGIQTAVVRDNDKDYQKNCVDNYDGHLEGHMKVFSDPDAARHTFEVCFYQDNAAVCDGLFEAGRKKLTVQEYMLSNKADAAFELLDKKAADLVAPKYIREAIEWIRA